MFETIGVGLVLAIACGRMASELEDRFDKSKDLGGEFIKVKGQISVIVFLLLVGILGWPCYSGWNTLTVLCFLVGALASAGVYPLAPESLGWRFIGFWFLFEAYSGFLQTSEPPILIFGSLPFLESLFIHWAFQKLGKKLFPPLTE